MAIFSKEESKRILQKALSFSKADECEVSLQASREGNIRYALNKVTTSGVQDDVNLSIESRFGKRSGTTTVNLLTDESIKQAVQRSEELARLAPESRNMSRCLGLRPMRKPQAPGIRALPTSNPNTALRPPVPVFFPVARRI